MRRIEKGKLLLDKMSRSEENIWKTFAVKCIRFSVLGNVVLLVTCFSNSQDTLHLHNPIVKLMLLVGIVSFMIGCGALITAKYICKKEGGKYDER